MIFDKRLKQETAELGNISNANGSNGDGSNEKRLKWETAQLILAQMQTAQLETYLASFTYNFIMELVIPV